MHTPTMIFIKLYVNLKPKNGSEMNAHRNGKNLAIAAIQRLQTHGRPFLRAQLQTTTDNIKCPVKRA